MNNFSLYFTLGLQHILSFAALDHLLFIIALCLRYQWHDWRKILILITAFTIGHSLTLALSALNIINLPGVWTEFCIAITILLTAINNLFVKNFYFTNKYPLIYFYALLFGLVHGLGFSVLLKNMLGRNESIIRQLLLFNLGIEAAQLIVVAIILSISSIFVSLLSVSRIKYIVFVSVVVAALAIGMIIQRIPV